MRPSRHRLHWRNIKGREFQSCRAHTFSRFVGADLREADLSDADFSETDFAGADFSHADLYGANLVGLRGLDTVKGLNSATNLDKATR